MFSQRVGGPKSPLGAPRVADGSGPLASKVVVIYSQRMQKGWNLVFVAVIAAVLFIGIAAVHRLNALADATEGVERSMAGLRSLDQTVAAMIDMESGARGYLLTTNEEYLEPFHEGSAAINELFDELDATLGTDAAQRPLLADLRRAAAARMEHLTSLVVSVDIAAPPIRMELVKVGRGKKLMDDVRSIAAQIEQSEQGTLSERAAAARSARAASRAIVIGAVALAAALGGIAILVNIDTTRRRRRLEREIRERTAAQSQLVANAREFETIANGMPQLVWTTDAAGRPSYFNNRWFEYLGLERASEPPGDWTSFAHPEDRPQVESGWAHALATGDPYQAECRICAGSDRPARWFIGRAVPLRSEDGKVQRWFGTWTDIDDQKRLQSDCERLLDSERAARNEAERSSRLKDEFVATVSHELRTPLNAMLGWTRILQRGADGDTVAQGLDVIERNIRTQIQLVEDLLDMSRALAGKLQLDLEPVELGALIATTVDSIAHAAESKGVRLQAWIDPDCPRTMADSRRMQQVVWNLLSNAVKFTPHGGHVRVSLRHVESHLEIEVEDDGQGIAPDFLPFVFDRFRQADGSTTRRHGGLGLGLAIVKHLVELHGGSVAATSDGLGAGARFVVDIPISAVGAMRSREGGVVPDGLPRLDGVVGLVVDDDNDARELVRRLLSDRGAEVVVAASADEAMRAFVTRRPDLVVSDIGMPDRDGLELIREIRRLEQATRSSEWPSGVPAIALSALARREDRQRAVMAGYNVFVAKPVEPTDLVQMAGRLTGR